MYQSIQPKNTTTASVRNSINSSPLRRGLLLTPLLFAFWAMPGTARGQMLASINGKTDFFQNGNGSIGIYDPDGSHSAFVYTFDKPRGIVFDIDGNLFVASNTSDELNNFHGTILKITPDGAPPVVFASGFATNFFLEALVMDNAGNLFVAAQNIDFSVSTIYKVIPGDTQSTPPFGSVPGQSFGLGFDSFGNLFATGATDSTNTYGAIYEFPVGFTPGDMPITFVGPDAFAPCPGPPDPCQGPSALAFDSSGDLFVSTTDGVPGNGEILEFPYDGFTLSDVPITFATGLTNNPRGIAFDSKGNLFVAEIPGSTSGDILEFPPLPPGVTEYTPPFTPFAAGIGSDTGNGGPEYLTFPPGKDTPEGSDVIVDLGTSGSALIDLTFPEITLAGTTTAILIDPLSAGMLSDGYELAGANLAFDITTTATYCTTDCTYPCANPITISFQVSPPLDATQLTVWHNEGGTLVNATCPSPRPGPTPTTNTVYASVCSLSPFVIAKFTLSAQIQQPINADGTSVFNVRRGVVPVKFTLTQDGTATCTLPPATIAVTRTAGGTFGPIDESVYHGRADTDSNFRIVSCQYIYNLSARALGVGTYRVDILINGQVVGSGIFQLK